jgi:two-component system NtrC family sensor kinase
VFRDLSFRYKIPIRGLVLIWITATVVSCALIYRAYEDLRRDIRQNSEALARVLADALVPEISHDAVWRAYGLVSAALRAPDTEVGNRPSFIVVLDTHYRVFVASHPERHPMLSDLPANDPDFAQVVGRLRETAVPGVRLVEPPRSEFFYLAMPIISDQVAVGSLVLAYPHKLFQPRLNRIIFEAGIITLLIIVAMLPFTWYWGSHLAGPLVELAGHMRNASSLPDPAAIRDGEGRDEIGELTAAFKRMLAELRDKRELEQQIVASDRLAALGRLSAGIAHEINNPLGGLLNAVSNLRRLGEHDARALKTLALIERGLNQIKDTVGALLVEAKVSRKPLTADDLEDVRTLALAQEYQNTATLLWQNKLDRVVALPSTQIRQVLLNLLLNAFQAVPEGGRVWARVWVEGAMLEIEVANEGTPIPEAQLPFLFEPFASGRENGSGLGLWVNYQIVRQLNGSIEASSDGGVTRFAVHLPIAGSEA